MIICIPNLFESPYCTRLELVPPGLPTSCCVHCVTKARDSPTSVFVFHDSNLSQLGPICTAPIDLFIGVEVLTFNPFVVDPFPT